MSARERLAAAFGTLTHRRGPSVVNCGSCAEDAAGALAADPHFAQDIEDGAALRRLREALPDSEDSSIVMQVFKDGSLSLQVWNGFGWRNASEPEFTENTLAAAADKAREAIEADR